MTSEEGSSKKERESGMSALLNDAMKHKIPTAPVDASEGRVLYSIEMGRSQVKYNRTHGRPGTAKGRGHGGRGRTESTAPGPTINKPHQSDNTWRYESHESASSGPSSSHLEQLLDLEPTRLPNFSEKPTEEESILLKGINVASMGKALAQLSVAERLRIPARLTVDLEVRSVGSKDRLTSESDNGKVENTISENLDVKDDTEDDLDAWLDTVIA